MDKARKTAFEATAATIIKQLARRNIEGYFCEDSEAAVKLVLDMVPQGASIGWGGSQSFVETGIKAALAEGGYDMIDRALAATPEEQREVYRRHFACDWFFMGTNAITLKGELVNIDGNANRLACLLHGPEHVVVIAGMNKVAKDVDAAIERVKVFACPPNAARLHTGTPCETLGVCGNCHDEGCMCCHTVITRHCRQTGRIKVILVAEDLGF